MKNLDIITSPENLDTDSLLDLYFAKKAEKLAAEKLEKAAQAEILRRAAGREYFETERQHVEVITRTRTDLDQAAVMEILTDLKREFPKIVTWYVIKAQEKEAEGKHARKITA
jgi:serine/threonine protein kinase HipA of HipAB toxin-antitoxin module